MSNKINLLLNKDSDLLKQQKRLKIVRVIAVGSLVIVLLISAVIFLLKRNVLSSSIKNDQDALLRNMSSLRAKQVKLTIVNNRINYISKVFNKRVDTYKIVNTLLGKVTDGISLESFSYNGKIISITFSSNSLLPLDELINNLIDMARRKEIIYAITLDSLIAQGEGGNYMGSISMNESL